MGGERFEGSDVNRSGEMNDTRNGVPCNRGNLPGHFLNCRVADSDDHKINGRNGFADLESHCVEPSREAVRLVGVACSDRDHVVACAVCGDSDGLARSSGSHEDDPHMAPILPVSVRPRLGALSGQTYYVPGQSGPPIVASTRSSP